MKKEIVSGLNGYIADTGVLYIKLHNLHWNIIGKQFTRVHEYLESLYDQFAEVLDASAEILRMNDEFPLASMKEYLAVSAIKEVESKEVTMDVVLDTVLKDLKHMKKTAESIRLIANEEDQYDVVNLLEDHLEGYNKTLWFIKSMMK